MLKGAVLAGLMAAAGQAQALTIGRDAFGYVATDTPYTFTDISGTGTRVLARADDATSWASIGFNFDFYGTSYSSAFFSSNELITFGAGNSSFSNVNISTTAISFPNIPAIAVFWDDLQFFQEGTDAVYYRTLGNTGNRQFVVQWNNVGGYSSSPSLATFQAVLFEGSNEILLNYRDTDFGNIRSLGGQATVGHP